MAEEFRFFLRTAVYVAIAGIVYWLLSYEASGTVLLAALFLAILAFIGVGLALARSSPDDSSSGLIGWLNRVIGFHERADAPAPLEAGPELVPTASSAPILAAAGVMLIGVGLIFGLWLIVPGVVVLLIAGIGWLTQLDSVDEAGAHR